MSEANNESQDLSLVKEHLDLANHQVYGDILEPPGIVCSSNLGKTSAKSKSGKGSRKSSIDDGFDGRKRTKEGSPFGRKVSHLQFIINFDIHLSLFCKFNL